MRGTDVTPSGIAYEHVPREGRPTVVLLHAGIADRRMWEPQWAPLSEEYGVLRLDLRGFGDSTAPPLGPLSPAEDVAEALGHCGVDSCHLVGASFGAGVAVEVALTWPGTVRSLVLCPPGGSLLSEVTDDLRAFGRAERDALEAGDLDAAVDANVTAWVVGPGRTLSDVDPHAVQLVRTMQRRAFEVDERWGEVDEAELDPPALDRLAEVAVPTLLLLGGHDLETTRAAVGRLEAGIPHARRVDWPDVAHLPSLEQPDRFLELLRDWLSSSA